MNVVRKYLSSIKLGGVKRKMISIFLVFVLTTTTTLGAPGNDVNAKIAGGVDTDIAQYPYTLQLEYMDELVCGAILVSPTYALTAAQCTVAVSTEYLLVRAGSAILYEGGQELTVNQIVYHPLYVSGTNYYGVALLHLSSAVSGINPVQLAANDDAIVEGASITMLGWGWEEFTYEAEFSTTLQSVDLPIVNDDVCSVYDIYAADVMFCAAYQEADGKGRCNGDNGGPAVINNIVVGVASNGQGCGDKAHGGSYIRSSKIKDWVDQIIAS